MRASVWRYRSLRQFMIVGALIILSGSVLAAAARSAGAQALPPQQKTDRPRVAVLDFDFGTVQRWWGGNWDVRRGLSDLVLTSLTRQGQFRVIERRALDALLKEQALSGSGIIDPATSAKIGKVLGVVIVGSVTQFGFDDKSYDLSTLSNKSRGGLLGNLFKAEAKRSKAVVAVDARLIDVNTAEILAVATGKGESARSSIGGLGADWKRGATGADMTSSNFQDTILGEATRRCVDKLARDLTRTAPKSVAVAKATYAGKVADVDGSTLILNVGTTHGARR